MSASRQQQQNHHHRYIRGVDSRSSSSGDRSDQDGDRVNVPLVVVPPLPSMSGGGVPSDRHPGGGIIHTSTSPRREHSVQRTPSLSSDDGDAFDEYINYCEDDASVVSSARRTITASGRCLPGLGSTASTTTVQHQQQQQHHIRCGTAPSRMATNPLSPPSRSPIHSPNRRSPHHHQDDNNNTFQGCRLISIVTPQQSPRNQEGVTSDIRTTKRSTPTTATTTSSSMDCFPLRATTTTIPLLSSSHTTTTTTTPRTIYPHTPQSSVMGVTTSLLMTTASPAVDQQCSRARTPVPARSNNVNIATSSPNVKSGPLGVSTGIKTSGHISSSSLTQSPPTAVLRAPQDQARHHHHFSTTLTPVETSGLGPLESLSNSLTHVLPRPLLPAQTQSSLSSNTTAKPQSSSYQADQHSSQHNTPEAFLPHPAFTIPGTCAEHQRGTNTASSGSSSSSSSSSGDMPHISMFCQGGGTSEYIQNNNNNNSNLVNSSLHHNSNPSNSTTYITSTSEDRHKHRQPTSNGPLSSTTGSGSVVASPTLPHQHSAPNLRNTSTSNRPYLQPLTSTNNIINNNLTSSPLGAVTIQNSLSSSSPSTMILTSPQPPPPPLVEFYNSSNSNSTPMNTSQGAVPPQEGSISSSLNYRKASASAAAPVIGGGVHSHKHASTHTLHSRAGTIASDLGRFVNSCSMTSFTGWGVEDGAAPITPSHHHYNQQRQHQFQPVNSNSFSLQAVSEFMSLLGPTSQAACRSSCKLFAKAFVGLVNAKQVPVVAHDDTLQHLIATGGMSTGSPSPSIATAAAGVGGISSTNNKKGGGGAGSSLQHLNASIISSSSVYERLGSSMVLSGGGGGGGDAFYSNTSPSLRSSIPYALSSPQLRQTPSMYHQVPPSLALAPMGSQQHHHPVPRQRVVSHTSLSYTNTESPPRRTSAVPGLYAGGGGWYDQDEDSSTRNHLLGNSSWSPETSPLRNQQQFIANHSSSITGSLARGGHMPLPLSANICAQLQAVATTPHSSRRLLGSPISESSSDGRGLNSPLSGLDVPAQSLHRRRRGGRGGNDTNQSPSSSSNHQQPLSIGGALQVFSEDEEDSEVSTPSGTKEGGGGCSVSGTMTFPVLQNLHGGQHAPPPATDADGSYCYNPPPSPRGATHTGSTSRNLIAVNHHQPAIPVTSTPNNNDDQQHDSILVGSQDRLFDTTLATTINSSEAQRSPLLNPTNRFLSSPNGGGESPSGSMVTASMLPIACGGATGGILLQHYPATSGSGYELSSILADQLDTTNIPRCVDVDEDDSTELLVRVPRHNRVGARSIGGSTGGSLVMSPNDSFRPTSSSSRFQYNPSSHHNSDLDDSLSLSCGRLNTSGSGLFNNNNNNISTSSFNRSPALSSTRFGSMMGSGGGGGGGEYYSSSNIHHNHNSRATPIGTTSSASAALTRCRSIKEIGNNLSFSGSIHSSVARSARGATLGSALRWAPVSLLSPHLGDLFIIVNVEAAAKSIFDFPNVEAIFIDTTTSSTTPTTSTSNNSPTTIATTTTPLSHSAPIHSIRILDEFCANISMKSIEITGCSKLVSVGRGFLAGVNATSIRYGPLRRLKEVGDEWMNVCPYVEHIEFSGDCESLRRVGDRWLAECFSIVTVDLSACHEVEYVGSNWLARCTLLSSIKFSTFHNLLEVGDRWLSSCQSLRSASFDGLSNLRSVGSGWLYAGATLTRVAFSGLLALKDVGGSWLADCLQLRNVSFNGMSSLHAVGAYWLARCAVLQNVSLLGVIKLSVVGPGWMASTYSPKVVCSNNNRSHVSNLIAVSFQRARGGGPASKEPVASEAPDPRLLLHTNNNAPTSPHRRRTQQQQPSSPSKK